MKKILLIICTLFFSLALFSCEGQNNQNDGLVAPEISLADSTISWNKVNGASEYLIYINNQQYAIVKETSYKLYLNPGEYKIKVSARNKDIYSSYSNEVTYIQDVLAEPIKLETPVITINNNVVTWNAIDYATQYNIYDNGNFYKATLDTSYKLLFSSGMHIITVKAISNVENVIESDFSNEVAFTPVMEIGTGELCIFEINDTHGSFVTDEESAGMEKVSTVINELGKPEIVKIANGDIFQGGYVSNVTYGKCFIDALNKLKFDAFIIGNHEFDWGIEKVGEYKDGDLTNGEANFPFLGANIINKNTGLRPEWMDEYYITESNGLKVGIIGTIGESLTSSIATDKVKDYEFLDPVPVVERLAKELRSKYNCDVVIVSEHDYNSTTNNRYAALKGESKIDAIVCGHTHQKISEKIRGANGVDVPVIQSYANNKCVGTIDLSLVEGNVTNSIITHYNPSNYKADPYLDDVISLYQDIIDEGNIVIGSTSTNLSRSKLGLIATNSMRDYFNADFGLVNRAGVRASIDSGTIKAKDIYRVFPFDNEIYIVDIPGENINSLYNHSSKYLYFSDNYSTSTTNNTKIYRLVLIDFVFTSPYNSKYFRGCSYEKTGIYIRDVVSSYFRGEIHE